MSIPYNGKLAWANQFDPDWNIDELAPAPVPSNDRESQVRRAASELFAQISKQPVVRSVQFIRDALRLVLKVPYRSIRTPVWLSKNWKQWERAKINAKLTGYSFVQMVSVPVKFLVALIALATSIISRSGAKYLLDKSECWTANLDGRASRLEALKEEGRQHAKTQEEFKKYKNWLNKINSKLCRKEG